MANMEPGGLPQELRRSVRTSMFVAATLRTATDDYPVRVRNMSAKGALVEAPSLPLVGSSVELARGNLIAMGTVAWCDTGRCGLSLTGLVDTQAWMSRAAPAHQAAVDQRIAEARAAIAEAPPAPAPLVEPTRGFDKDLTPPQQEIAHLLERLETLGEALTADIMVIAVHGDSLQIIDELQQRLQALSRRLT